MSTTITKTPPRKKLRKDRVSIRLNPIIREQAEQLARADKRSFSQFVEIVLERYLQAIHHENNPLLQQAFGATQHGFWSQFDAYEAAANLQTLLQEQQT